MKPSQMANDLFIHLLSVGNVELRM